MEINRVQFTLSHVWVPHDFVKIDIDGAEVVLLDYEEEFGPSRGETHRGLLSEQKEIAGGLSQSLGRGRLFEKVMV